MSRRKLGTVLAASALALGTAGCGSDAESAETLADVVRVDFDSAVDGDIVTARNLGWAQVELREVANEAGSLPSGPGPDGDGYAVRFPAYDETDPALASLAIVPRGETDVLSPGTADFVFGADFSLDARSEGNPVDDGNNVLQRGLFSDPAQYKIQVDQGIVSCRVAGTEGELLVRATEAVEPETWYRATCERSGDTVTLSLQRLDEEGSEEQSWSEEGVIGEVQMAAADSPLAVGGKVTSDIGVSVQSSDQFNGLIDNVLLAFRQ